MVSELGNFISLRAWLKFPIFNLPQITAFYCLTYRGLPRRPQSFTHKLYLALVVGSYAFHSRDRFLWNWYHCLKQMFSFFELKVQVSKSKKTNKNILRNFRPSTNTKNVPVNIWCAVLLTGLPTSGTPTVWSRFSLVGN